MSNSSDLLHFILFADDTSVFMSHNNLCTLVDLFNSEINKLSEWLINNKLVLNVAKTQYIVFTKRRIEDNFAITFYGHQINRTSCVKFLGVHIDESLTWHEHVGVVCNRVAKVVGIIYRLRHFPRHILVMLYYALIFSHVNYSNIAWSNNHDYFITKLFVLQKKAIRIISNSPYHTHTLP